MFKMPTKFDKNTYSECVAELEKMLRDVPFDPDIEEILLGSFAVMEGSNNPLDEESKITSRAESYGLITEEEARDLLMGDIRAQSAK